jgi:UDP-glucose 4-epimerase
MRIFITGGAGFIGSHLADHYVAKGDQVTILDNFSTGSQENIAHLAGKVTTIDGDIRNIELVEKLTKEADLVLHMAAALGVNTILDSPLESMSTNITGSEVVLNAAAKFNKRVIIASTSEIYGKNPKQPLSETDDRVVGAPQKIRWTYSDAKAIEEAMATALHAQRKLPVTTVRLFNTVGPRQSGRYGMVVPRFVQAALKNQALTIYGDGTQSRVFCHVDDAVQAIATIAATDATIGEVFNVGGSGEVSIKQLAERVIATTKSQSVITYTSYTDAYPAGFEDIQRRVPDISKIKQAIGWAPTKDLEKIIRDIAEI